MNFAELIAAFHALPPEDQRRFFVEIRRKRGRRPKPYDAKLAKARELINRVETKRDELGSLQAAYPALATAKQNANTVETYYIKAKRLIDEDWIDNEFNILPD